MSPVSSLNNHPHGDLVARLGGPYCAFVTATLQFYDSVQKWQKLI